MRKIFAALILTAVLSCTSWADVIYTTDSGKLGTIGIQSITSIDRTPEVHYTGLGSNTFAAPFWDGEQSRVIVLDRAVDDTASWDKAFVFEPSSLKEPVQKLNGLVLEGIRNTQAAVSSRNGRGLFLASRENASLVELNTENLNYVRSYTYTAESGDSTPHMQGVLLNYSRIYAVVEAGEEKSVFFRFDGQLKEKVSGAFKVSFPQEAVSMTWLSDTRIAAAVSSGVGLLDGYGFYLVVSTDNPAKSVCSDHGSGFYFTTQTEEDGAYTSTLHHYSVENEAASEIRSEPGKGCQVINIGGGMVVAVLGEKILICNSSEETVIREFDSNALDGVPVYITTRETSGEKYDSSSGSCNLSGAGIIMLLTFAGIALKSRK